MATLRAQVHFPFISNKPEDVTVNTWHFLSSVDIATAADQIKIALDEFYNTTPPALVQGGSALTKLSDYMSNAQSRVVNAVRLKVYDLADAKPRAAVERTMSLFPSAFLDDKELPAEVALCVSMVAGRNIARQRGRIYLGPFNVAATNDGANQRSAPVLALVNSAASSLRRLITPTLATVPGIDLAVFSRVDGIARVATAGWVDDAWDTQRRRGQDAVTRVAI